MSLELVYLFSISAVTQKDGYNWSLIYTEQNNEIETTLLLQFYLSDANGFVFCFQKCVFARMLNAKLTINFYTN